jgi:hypothetical protein
MAKKAEAFFMMSRSWRSWVTSRRSRCNSLRSSSVNGTAGWGRVAAIQFRNVLGVIPTSRAIAGIASVEVRARRTTSALNSGLYVGRRRWAMWNSSAHSAPSKVSTEASQRHLVLRSSFFVLRSPG